MTSPLPSLRSTPTGCTPSSPERHRHTPVAPLLNVGHLLSPHRARGQSQPNQNRKYPFHNISVFFFLPTKISIFPQTPAPPPPYSGPPLARRRSPFAAPPAAAPPAAAPLAPALAPAVFARYTALAVVAGGLGVSEIRKFGASISALSFPSAPSKKAPCRSEKARACRSRAVRRSFAALCRPFVVLCC